MESTSTAQDVRSALAEFANPADGVRQRGYFKGYEGGYGAGDVFLGLRVPLTRSVVKRFRGLGFDEIDALLDDAEHEHRLAGVLLLNDAARRDPHTTADRYLAAVRRGRVNNWDLVDASAEYALGGWLYDRERSVLDDLAASPVLWERRVAVLATFAFIKRGDASTTLALAERLLGDREDLMHKAVGWMLREVGKRVSREALLDFLDVHAPRMPRTMLSYATEHLSPEERVHYRGMR
ncbi:DNA alkylation repair protein [Pseudolysinimonas sp.]|uniref:DNA alkylation repair protein n=1 Tax=Pseudolysinimonas sp. TaxID=2680009 RepID=UPI00286D5DA6|nr:DNA alkylation repair protein [Pseudolysinimonas sp.]